MTHTEYKTGIWYGWNGGQCPVHPETVVEWLHVSKYGDSGPAGQLTWGFGDTGIAAFRIVTPYVEPEKPREWWMHELSSIGLPYTGQDDYHKAAGYIHVREVIEADDQ